MVGDQFMLDGVFFYWFSWIFCVIIVFFMKKGMQRTYLLYWVLTSIMLVNQFINIDSYTLSVGFIVTFWGAFIGLASLGRTIYHLVISLVIMIGYAGLLLIEVNAPIWVFIPRYLLIAGTCTVLISILTKDFYSRVMTTLVGLSSGEILYNFITANYFFPSVIGDLAFMDIMMIIVFLLFLMYQYQQLKYQLTVYLKYQSRI